MNALRWDENLRRLTRNALTLIGGNGIQAAAALITVAITARALSPGEFGVLVLVSAYALIVSQVVGFQSWQAIIRYASTARAEGNRTLVGSLLKLGVCLDLAAAGTAALLAAAGVLMGRWLFDLTPQTQSMAYLFCISIASGIVGTPTAILRMFERYSAFVIQAAAGSAVKIAVVVAAYLMQVGLWGFALSWVVVQIVSNALLVLLAFAELKKQEYGPIRRYSARNALTSYPDVIGFFITTNLNGMARVLRDLDVPLVGIVLGPVAAGTFKLARQFAGALNKLIDPFFQAIYPDLARLHAQNDTKAAMSLVRRSSAMLGACGIVVLVAFLAVGRLCVELVLGPTYDAVFPVAAWCVAASVVWAFAQPLSPMLMVLGRHRVLLVSNTVTSAAYLGAVALVCHFFGAVGAGAAFFGFLTVWAATAAWLLVTASRRSSSQEPRPASPYEEVRTSATTGREVVVKR